MATPHTITPACPLELTMENPHRRPDWRWQKAAWRIGTGSRRGERRDDEWTLQAVRCQRGHRRVACGRRPYRPQPDVEYAFNLCRKPDWLHAELEARIIANQPIGEISAATGVPEGVISAFEAMFFDVRPRLAMGAWIALDVIGLKPMEPLAPLDVVAAWKLLGFTFGPLTIDALMAGSDRAELEKFGLRSYWSPASRLPKELQLALLVRSLPQRGRKALQSLTRFVEMGLCEVSPFVEPPPMTMSLDLSTDLGTAPASWNDELNAFDRSWERPVERAA